MAEKQPAIIQEGQATVDDIPLTSLEESLLSLEKLDRASPEIWPEQKEMSNDKNNNQSDDSNDECPVDCLPVPGLSEYMTIQSPSQSPPAWSRGLTGEDVNLMHQLGSLSTSGLVIEVKKLHDLAYQLGVEEAKEMTRGKYLSVFTSRRHR